MFNTKKVFTFMTVLICSVFFSMGSIHVLKAAEITPTPSQDYALKMEPGWNLGNTFDGFDTNGDRGEESWGNPKVTKELIQSIKAEGFNSIRIPFTALMRIGEGPDYTIDPVFLERYAEVVNWALDEGLYVMINLHHDSWNWAKNIGSDDGSALEQYKAIWRQLAEYFKDYPDKVCFESLNEPQFNGTEEEQIAINNQVNQVFYDIARNSGGKNTSRMLVLPTLYTNDSQERCTSLYNAIKALNDPHIIATFHYYGPWTFSVNIAGQTTFNDTVKNEINGAFDRVFNTFVSQGIGVICGEYGLLGFDTSLDTIEKGEVLKYMEYLGYYAKQKEVTMMLWDNGQHFNRYDYTWSNPSMINMIKTSLENRSSYTESDRIFIKKGTGVSEVTEKLSLNGNTLISIHDGNGPLVLDQDYTISTLTDDTVTLKASYLEGVLTNTYGENAALTFKFSQGEDWKVFIHGYDRATMAPAQDTTDSLTIPVNYNGDLVSTMEALYEDGTAAGPQNWTTYKEFGKTFKPNYTDQTLTITSDFFAETNNGQVTLKVHFLSGEVVTYTIVKSENTVTGTPVEVNN